jgi:hypothetical protein
MLQLVLAAKCSHKVIAAAVPIDAASKSYMALLPCCIGGGGGGGFGGMGSQAAAALAAAGIGSAAGSSGELGTNRNPLVITHAEPSFMSQVGAAAGRVAGVGHWPFWPVLQHVACQLASGSARCCKLAASLPWEADGTATCVLSIVRHALSKDQLLLI